MAGISNRVLQNNVVLVAVICSALCVRQAGAQVDVTEKQLDPRAQWLLANAVIVEAIDSTAIENDEFADLMPMRELIGDARVVSLGEQSHGDGATFQAKVRLVRFLHEVMGFDLFVWESGMYDCTLVNQAFHHGLPPEEAVRKGIFPIWTMSDQVKPVFEYVAQTFETDRPLEIAGFDSQITGPDTAESIAGEIDALFHSLPADAVDEEAKESVRATVKALGNMQGNPYSPERKAHETFQASVGKLIAILDESEAEGAAPVLAKDRRSFLARALRNVAAFEKMMACYVFQRQEPQRATEWSMQAALAREESMADTLIWLAKERYPERKMIVWAASSHMTYNPNAIEMYDHRTDEWNFDENEWAPMGDAVRKALGDDLYAIMFIAYDGMAGSVFRPAWKLPPAPDGSLGEICHQTGKPYLFIDLRMMPSREGGGWLNKRLVARPRGYALMRAVWGEVCDGMFFTDHMFPSTRTSPLPLNSEN